MPPLGGGPTKALRVNSSTLITARKGLPVSLGGDGAKQRTLTTDGYPTACPFWLGKTRIRAVTMAGQRLAHTVVGRGVTPASDVNAKALEAINLGKARGVGPIGSGLAHGTPGIQIPEAWERAASRSLVVRPERARGRRVLAWGLPRFGWRSRSHPGRRLSEDAA
jgi:hypothetical protein